MYLGQLSYLVHIDHQIIIFLGIYILLAFNWRNERRILFRYAGENDLFMRRLTLYDLKDVWVVLQLDGNYGEIQHDCLAIKHNVASKSLRTAESAFT